MRQAGLIPAVLYGHPGETESLSINPKDIVAILRSEQGENSIFQLKIGESGTPVQSMIREYQLDPVTYALLHADLIRIAADKLLHLDIPIEFQGEAPGIKEGGLLEHVLRDVKVECLPAHIPDHIIADVSGLGIGGLLRARELKVPDRVKLLVDPDVVIATVAMPRKEEEAVPAEAAPAEESAEPEVLKKGKAATESEEAEEGKK